MAQSKTFLEFRKQEIEEQAKFIMQLLRGSSLYGKEIDLTDMKEVLVAAFYAGQADRDTDMFKEIFKRT